MRADVIRLYKTVHTWTGIVAGMALFIAFYAGALTVFKEPLARWVAPPSAGAAAVPLERAGTLVARTLAANPAVARDFTLYLSPTEDVPARMGWHQAAPGADDHDRSGHRHYAASLDAAGNARIDELHQSQVAEFIDVLHRVVGLPFDNDPSRWVMGVFSALYAVALISGVIVLLPTLVKDFFALRLGRNLKRMWLDAHNVVGIVSLPFHIVMAISAAVFAFHDGIYAVQDKAMYDGRLATLWSPRAAPPAAPRDPAAMLAPADLVARAQALSPTFEPVALQYSGVTGARAAVRVWGRDSGAIARSARGGFAVLDPYTGQVKDTDYMPRRQDAANTVIISFFSLHFATFGGTPVQWMYFVLGLGGAFLFYTGNLLWVESRRKADRGRGQPVVQKRSTFLMAAATVGVCLGCVIGVSLTLAAGKWLHGRVADLNAWHMGVYYAAFFAALAWAFVRGAARAAPHLLAAAAVATAFIPLSSLVGWAWPGSGAWAHGSGATLGVDAVALAGALTFGWMAQATLRRTRNGPTDSVWSSHPGPVENKTAGEVQVEAAG